MVNILLTGIGGQGTVLAAKLLAQAALDKGWQVRTAETIGMAQRGGSVISHVRIAEAGEKPFSTLIPKGCAQLIVAFEPSEAARVLPYLAADGTLVSATTAVQPVTAALAAKDYDATVMANRLRAAFENVSARFVLVDDAPLLNALGTRKVLNTLLLAEALKVARLPISLDDLERAIEACVKPRFVPLNLQVVDAVRNAD